MELWKNVPGLCEETPVITPYIPVQRQGDGAVVIFPGGGYAGRAPHEGAGYAEFLQAQGIAAFVVDYRVAPHRYPLPQLDARQAVRWVRARAGEYGVDPQKIAVMGSSAGGHLAAFTAAYGGTLPQEPDSAVDGRPNAQVLCYPVICPPTGDGVSHGGSYHNLIGGLNAGLEQKLDPIRHVDAHTPPAFIWHTADDPVVSVLNSYRYAMALKRFDIPVELHVFPHGRHGLGLSGEEPHAAQWASLLLRWLSLLGW